MAQIRLHLPMARSLKDKRQVLKSLLAQIENRFSVAVGEVGSHDRWQSATVGIACISTDSRHADEIIAHVVDFVHSRAGDYEMLGYETEVLHAF
jgi:uncharacterized protein